MSYLYLLSLVKIGGITLIDKNLLVIHKKIIINSFIKGLSVIEYKYFVGIIEIKDKKALLAFIKQKNDLRDAF